HFIAQSALGSLVTNAYNTIFAVVYALLAQSQSLVVSFGIAIAVWTVLTFAGGSVAWTVPSAVILNIVVIGLALWISAPLRHAPMPASRDDGTISFCARSWSRCWSGRWSRSVFASVRRRAAILRCFPSC